MAQKRKVLKEVLFDDVEEKIEYDFLTPATSFFKSTRNAANVGTWCRNVGKIPTKSERI